MTSRVEAEPHALLVFMFLFVTYVVYGTACSKMDRFLYGDPAIDSFSTASLADDLDLNLHNQLEGDPAFAADQIALGKNGEWYNVHEPLLSLIAVPFYMGLGLIGLLVFNILMTAGLVLVCFATACRFVSRRIALLSATCVGLSSHFMEYSISFSHDVLGALVITGAFCALQRRHLLAGGFICGLLPFARMPFVPVYGAFIFYIIVSKMISARGRMSKAYGELFSDLAIFAIPLGLSCLLFMAVNYMMFGSPFELSYNRWVPSIVNDHIIVAHSGYFNGNILRGFMFNMFDSTSGMFPNSPLLTLSLVLGLRPLFKKEPATAAFVISLVVTIFIIFSLYSHGFPSAPNRYHLAIIAISVVPLGCLIEELIGKKYSE